MRETDDQPGQLLARARSGDGDAFAELTGPFRRELQVHCYRILGSAADAEDMLQETMMAAWRGLGRFQERVIAADLAARDRHQQVPEPPARQPRRAAARARRCRCPRPPAAASRCGLSPTRTRCSATCRMPPLGPRRGMRPGNRCRWPSSPPCSTSRPGSAPPWCSATCSGSAAAEAAGILGCTVGAANNLLKRARATIAGQLPPGGRDQAPLPGSAREQQVIARFADAFERGDVPAIVALLTDDAWLTMPPLPFEYQGPALIGHFLYAVSFRHGTQRSRLIPTRANGQPAFGRYLGTRMPGSATRTGCSSSPSPATASAPSPASPTTACWQVRAPPHAPRLGQRGSQFAGLTGAAQEGWGRAPAHDAASSRARSSASRDRDAAATFSSRWTELPVPGMTRTLGAWCEGPGQANLGGVAPWRLATSSSCGDSVPAPPDWRRSPAMRRRARTRYPARAQARSTGSCARR